MLLYMNIESLKKYILNLDLYKWKLIQTNLDSLVIFKSKYKYTDCIYMNIDINGANIRYERVFDNKYLNLPIDRLLISKIHINKEIDLIKYIKDIE